MGMDKHGVSHGKGTHCNECQEYESSRSVLGKTPPSTVCCPVFGRDQFPAKKRKLGYFQWDFNSSSTEAIRRKNKHLCYQLMVLAGFLIKQRANKKGFCSGE